MNPAERWLAARGATTQPEPVATGQSAPVLPALLSAVGDAAVREALEARARLGLERYGTALHSHNGRDAEEDALQEALDGLMYVQQAMMEWGSDARLSAARDALLSAATLLLAEVARCPQCGAEVEPAALDALPYPAAGGPTHGGDCPSCGAWLIGRLSPEGLPGFRWGVRADDGGALW